MRLRRALRVKDENAKARKRREDLKEGRGKALLP